MKNLKAINLEMLFWLAALVLLACNNNHTHHFTLCPLANLGFENWCPGCGLGRSISHLLHGEFAESFKAHWFGLPALLLIFHRMYTIIKHKKQTKILILNT